MSNREDSDIDDDFSELYKEYTGPPRSTTTSVPETTKTSKRSHADSDEEEQQETLDPNAIPTDFTSRDAKVWEAKSKATERNWKKRKEEEMICKLCGDSSHYTQGCPSTLGANRKSQDLFQRVPARDPQVKALFTDRVVKNIEKDIGCKIKIEEKFIIVSGKDGQTLSKGVDAVHKVKDEGVRTGESHSDMGESRSRSPKGKIPVSYKIGSTDSQRSSTHSPRNSLNYDQRSTHSPRNPSNYDQRSAQSPRNPLNYDQRSNHSPRNPLNNDPRSNQSPRIPSNFDLRSNQSPGNPLNYDQRSNHSPRDPSSYDQRSGRQEKMVKEHAREEVQKHPRRSPQAYGNVGIQSRSTHSKSPALRPSYSGAYDLNDNHMYERGPSLQPIHQEGYSTSSVTMEELELEYKRDAMNIAKIRDKEEDEENYRHSEALKEIRENYMKRLATVRQMHEKKWEEFLQPETRKRQQETHQQMANVGFGGYKNNNHYDYGGGGGGGGAAASDPYINNMQTESRTRYPELDNYPSMRPNMNYYDFQRQQHEDYGEPYNRY